MLARKSMSVALVLWVASSCAGVRSGWGTMTKPVMGGSTAVKPTVYGRRGAADFTRPAVGFNAALHRKKVLAR